MHALDDVFCVVFTVGLIEYQQVLYEDASLIRMKESLALFKQWANHKVFSKAPIILAFTKRDTYEQTFSAAGLTKAFPDFAGSTPVEGIAFLKDKFQETLTKREASVPFKTFVLDTTSADESLSLLNAVRQLVATHRADFLMNAVHYAVEARKKEKKRRGTLGMGGVLRRGSIANK